MDPHSLVQEALDPGEEVSAVSALDVTHGRLFQEGPGVLRDLPSQAQSDPDGEKSTVRAVRCCQKAVDHLEQWNLC